MQTLMFIAWYTKQNMETIYMSLDELVHKEINALLVVRKNEILSFATTWMDLKGFVLSEKSQRKKIFYNLSYMKLKKKENNKTLRL